MDTKMVKTVGEHWVCATLARHGWAPALTRDGLERTDILAVNTELPYRPVVEIQVKTASQRGQTTKLFLGTKAQLPARSEHEWFVLILLPELPNEPRAFVVPRDHLAAAAWIVHQNWRTDPSAPSGKRNADLDQARISWTVWVGYEDRWDLLGTPAAKIPVLLPQELHSLALTERVGLPPTHPWHQNLPTWLGRCREDASESTCRPGTVTPLPVTCSTPLPCHPTCCFTSHGFSSVLAFFRRLAELRRNWRTWNDGVVHGSDVLVIVGLCAPSPDCQATMAECR